MTNAFASPQQLPTRSLEVFTWIQVALLVAAIGSLLGQAAAQEKKQDSIRVAGYDYKLPAWWDSVKVDVPDGLKNAGQVEEYVRKEFGKDTGVKATWKEALKVHTVAAQRLNRFPVYLAHCHMTGEEYARAAEIYGDLYKLADTQGKNKHWYQCYLAYSAGRAYYLLKEPEKAKLWYARAADYVGHGDPAISHYANESANVLKELKEKK